MVSLFDKRVDASLGKEKLCLFIGEEVVLKRQAPFTFLEGFDTLKAITFSSSGKFLLEFLKNFQRVELLIGVEEDSYEIDYLAKIGEELNFLLPAFFQLKEITIYHLPNCHLKLYLLSKSTEPIQRALIGSANLSQNAWLGSQEELFVVIDKKELIEELERYYENLKVKAKPVIAREVKEKLNEEAKKYNINVNIENVFLSENFINQREELKDVAFNLLCRNVAIDLPLEQHILKLKEKKVSLEKAENFFLKLKEKRIHYQLAGNNLKKLKEINQDLKDEQLQEEKVLEWDFSSGQFLYKGLMVIEYPEEKEREEKVVSLLREYFELSRESSYMHPILIGEAIVFAFNAPLTHFIRQKAYELDYDLNLFPVFALLAGTAKAGKSTVLEVIARLLGIHKTNHKVNYQNVAKTKGSRAYTIKDALFSEDLIPYLIDEVNPLHFSADKTLQEVLKSASEDEKTTTALILTSNLNDFSGGLQILRRACFLPFENQIISPRGKGVTKILQNLNPALFLKFLKYVSTQKEKIELPDPEDPLKIAREFLLNEGVPVPESYQGRYERFIREGWKNLYMQSPEIFEEIEAESKHYPDKMVKCFKVPKNKVGYLTPLETFDNSSIFPDYHVLLKEEFLQEIQLQKVQVLEKLKQEDEKTKISFFDRLKKIFIRNV